MRKLTILTLFLLVIAVVLTISAQPKTPPAKLTLKAKFGDVTFDHAAHTKREGNKCETCHPKLWPQSATAPLKYKPGPHAAAEKQQASCGTCHHPGGQSFEAKGNCNKCHVKAGAKG
jgi:c(7)-type cytochrome triheme protein